MRHALRNILIGLIGLVALAGLGLATPPGHGIVAGIITRAASGNGVTVAIDGLSGWPPFWLGANKVTLADDDGVFAEIDGLAVDVRATALLRGALALDAISAGRVAIARRPHLPGGGAGGSLLPFAADAVSVARLELGPQLAGSAAALSLNGSIASGTDGSLTARIDAERIDGRAGSLKGTITRTGSDALPAVDLTITEDADGVLAGLTGSRGAPAYDLAAKTAVDGDTLSGTLALHSTGAAHFDGRFTLSPAGDGARRLQASGSGDLAELVPHDFADIVSGPIDVAVDADFASATSKTPAAVNIRQGLLTTATVRAEASGAVGNSAADLALSLKIARTDGGTVSLPFGGTQIGSMTIAGKVAPAGDVLRLDLSGQVAGLQMGPVTIPTAGVSLAVEAAKDNPLSGKLPFGLRLEASAITTPTGRIESVAAAPLALAADGSYDTSAMTAATNAKLDIAGGTASFAGTLSADGANGDFTTEFADLKPMAPLAGRPIAGALTAKAQGTVGAKSALRFEATTTDLDPGQANAARLLAGETKFGGALTNGAGGLVLSDLAVKGAALDATGNLALAADAIEGALDARVSDLSLLADASSGGAVVAAKISGKRARPQVAATITIASGKLLNQPAENVVVGFDGAPANGGWQGALKLTGGFAGKPLAGTAAVTLDAAGLFAFPAVDLAVGDNHVKGALTRTADGTLAGTLNVDAPNLKTLAALGLVDASGAGVARVDFKPDGARQSLAVSFTGNGLAAAGLAAGDVAGNVAVDDAFGAARLSGTITARRLTAGSVVLDSVQLTTTSANGATQYTATASGGVINLSASGSLAGTPAARAVRLDTLSGTAYGLPVKLTAPLAFNLGGGPSGIAGATFAMGGGTVRLDGSVSPTLNLTIVANNIVAAVVNGFVPGLGAEGTVTGRATVTGQVGAPAVAWNVNLTGLRVAATRSAGLPALALSASGNATLAATNISARLSGGGLTLAIDGQAPFRGGQLALKATGSAPLALLALQSNRELRLGGSANLNIAVGGTIAVPTISGTVDLVAATIADTDTGLGIAGATGRITFDGDRATIAGLAGHLIQGGDITASGSVAIRGAGLPADLAIKIANGRYADGKVINTRFNADLALKGPLLGNGRLSGKIDLGHTDLELPDRLAGSATAIDVRHVNAPRGFKPPRARESTAAGSHSGGAIVLDIALAANSGLTVRGFGVDAEFGGMLQLTGTSGNPQTAGAFQMQRGRIELLGRRFDFSSGTLTFNGDLVPVLDFTGTTQATDGTVTLNVTGPANNPQIGLSSSPARPEEEILSRLLFDQTVGNLSPLQAAQLVDAVAQLTGALGGGGLFDRVRRATGFDDLDIRQSATGGTTVGVAKRINDKLRVGVEAGSDSGAGRVVVDLNVTKNLKARGEAGETGEGKVGLTYEKEY
jgi:translocation and assembly module TamB